MLRGGCAAESGTHSILDMTSVGDRRAPGVAACLSADQLDALFGTVTPSRAQIEAEATLIGHLRQRGEGTYIVAFEQGEPVAAYFCGSSALLARRLASGLLGRRPLRRLG